MNKPLPLPLLVLAVMAGLLVVVVSALMLLDTRRRRRASDLPLTPLSAFRGGAPEASSRVKGRERLTSKGATLLSFVCVFGAVGLALTGVLLAALARDQRGFAAVAAIPAAALDLAVVLVARRLRRDHMLVKEGRLATGIVVQYVPQGGYVLTYYDFPCADQVLRGQSMLDARTTGSPYFRTAKGAGVEVFYLPQNPRLNALSLSLCWQL
ncbi:MAG: hypothetical protein JOY55_02400 [Mycobacterium sp.]|nr:hypothetical protein [Burkholderiaceae bacterium]MBV8290668.1 hypothetical protein [Mycobacterium sp.]